MIKLKILRGRSVLDCEVGSECNHRYPYEINTESRRDTGGQCDHGGSDVK